jgi:hypothetical protein
MNVARLIETLKEYPGDCQLTIVRNSIYLTSGVDIKAVISMEISQGDQNQGTR